MFNPYIIIAVILAFLGSFIAGYSGGAHNAKVSAALEMEQIKRQYAQTLADQTAKTLEAERAATIANQQIDIVKNEAEQKINHDLSVNLAAAKRLRFKSTIARCRPVPNTKAPSKPVELAEKSEFVELPRAIETDLFRLAAKADRLRAYANACHAWAKSLVVK